MCDRYKENIQGKCDSCNNTGCIVKEPKRDIGEGHAHKPDITIEDMEEYDRMMDESEVERG